MSESSRPSTPEPFTPEGVAKTINERAGFELHAWQAEAVALLKNDKDVLLTAAPGAGKSIVYLGAALLMSERHVAVIVFHPEEAGHRAQVARARKLGLQAASYDVEVSSWRSADHAASEAAFFATVASRETTLIFISPERLINSLTWLALRTAEEQDGFTWVSFVVLEDAHLVSTDSMGEWMPEWTKLRMSFPLCPMLVISGSMSPKAQEDSVPRLKLKPDYTHISQPLDRANVFVAVVQMQGVFKDRCNLEFVFTKMDGRTPKELADVPQAVVFEDTKTQACECAAHLQAVGSNKYGLLAGNSAEQQPFVVAYHAKLTQEEKIDILRRYKAGAIRILVTTEALGLDLDVLTIQRVVSYNSDFSDDKRVKADALMKRISLAGKDGSTKAVVVILAQPWMLGEARKDSSEIDTVLQGPDGERFSIDPTVHTLLKLTEKDCYKVQLLALFNAPDTFEGDRCQNCHLCLLAASKQDELHLLTGQSTTEAALAEASTLPPRLPALPHAELRLVQREFRQLRDRTYRDVILPSFVSASRPLPPNLPYLINLDTMRAAAEAYTLGMSEAELHATIGNEWIGKEEVGKLKEKIDFTVRAFREAWREEKILLRWPRYWA